MLDDDLPIVLGDDSEDLLDAEVEQAIALASVEALLAHLKETRCSTCEDVIETSRHALRRRTPYMYWRMSLRCRAAHETKLVVRADWLNRESS
jgi:hypothetical protein